MVSSVENIKQSALLANELMKQLGEVRRSREVKQVQLNARIQQLKDQYGPGIETDKQKESKVIEQLLKIVLPQFALLAVKNQKTIKFRNGTIALRKGKAALVVTEPAGEDAVIRRIAARGGLRRFTRMSKRTLDKDALKKDPDFVAKVKGIEIQRKTSVVIKPSKVQGEIVLSTESLSVPIMEEAD